MPLACVSVFQWGEEHEAASKRAETVKISRCRRDSDSPFGPTKAALHGGKVDVDRKQSGTSSTHASSRSTWTREAVLIEFNAPSNPAQIGLLRSSDSTTTGSGGEPVEVDVVLGSNQGRASPRYPAIAIESTAQGRTWVGVVHMIQRVDALCNGPPAIRSAHVELLVFCPPKRSAWRISTTRHLQLLGYDHPVCHCVLFNRWKTIVWQIFRLPEVNTQLMRRAVLAVSLVLGGLAGTMSPSAWADSRAAYCVLSKPNTKAIPLQGPCRWSQRQGNVNITFQAQEFDFPADQDGKSYTRMNRDGAEAGAIQRPA
ncbi:MAG: hypothetical protein ACK52U_04005 [Synechococcaceae cyanobacterium]